jgi:hypothetical protein
MRVSFRFFWRDDLRREGRAGRRWWTWLSRCRKVKRGTYEFVDRRQEPKRFLRLPQTGSEQLTGMDLNDSSEAKEGAAHTTELLEEMMKLALEFHDGS